MQTHQTDADLEAAAAEHRQYQRIQFNKKLEAIEARVNAVADSLARISREIEASRTVAARRLTTQPLSTQQENANATE